MKNYINYYYHFYVTDIRLCRDKYFFSYNNDKYMFCECTGIKPYINSIYKLSKQLNYYNKYYHEMVYNKDYLLVTTIQNKEYVMLKLSKVVDDKISIYDIKGKDYINVSKDFDLLLKFHWIDYWENKIDYFENIIMTKKSEYYIYLDSFYYYVGLAENAVIYIKEAITNIEENYSNDFVASHRRFTTDMSLIDFYNPILLIIDHRSRDVAEFLKYSFLNNDYDINTIREYLKKYNLNRLGAHLLFGRLLFPSFYFDCLEGIINGKKSNTIYMLETSIKNYNMFLNDIFEILSNWFQMQEISWLKIKKM